MNNFGHNYTVFSVNNNLAHMILSKVATATYSTQERSYNALVLREYQEIFHSLRLLKVEDLQHLATICKDSFTILVNMDGIAKHLSYIRKQQKILLEQEERARWLIQNKASDKMVLNICGALPKEDIKRIRIELGIFVTKGRTKLPSYEECVAIRQEWERIIQEERNTYQQYCKLKKLYPYLELAQLHTIVARETE